MKIKNLFKITSGFKKNESFEVLLATPDLKLERIVSFGQSTPKGEWLRQKSAEWVVLLSGSARITFFKNKTLTLKPGDYIFIPAGKLHRVEETHPKKPSLWLAAHLK